MRAREEWQKQLAAADEEEDADVDALEVFGDEDVLDEEDEDEDAEPAQLSSKAKGKARATDDDAATPDTGKKRRRAAVDPFAGGSHVFG